MKKIYTLFSIIIVCALITSNTRSINHPDGEPTNTGSPGDGGLCNDCHGGGLSVDNTWISTDIPLSGYLPGQTYTITLSISTGGSSSKGFSLTCENSSNAKTGTFIITDAAKTWHQDNHVTHTEFGTGSSTWSCNWTAPASGKGAVTFYAAFVKNGFDGGVVTASQNYAEGVTSISEASNQISINLHPNPVQDKLNIELKNIKNDNVLVSIYAMSGQIILNDIEIIAGNSFSKSYDLSKLNSGMYIVKINNGSTTYTKRIIVN